MNELEHLDKLYKNLQAENKRLREALQAALRIKQLWLPSEEWEESHKSEAIALTAMFVKIEQALGKE